MKKQKPIRSADETYLHLNKTENFQRFFSGLINFLQKRLKRVEIEGTDHWVCGEAHEKYNNNWQPFKNLWEFTEKQGLDFYAARDLVEEKLYKELVCECLILGGYEKIKQKELERMGIYFGEPGRREVDIVSGSDKIDKGLF